MIEGDAHQYEKAVFFKLASGKATSVVVNNELTVTAVGESDMDCSEWEYEFRDAYRDTTSFDTTLVAMEKYAVGVTVIAD